MIDIKQVDFDNSNLFERTEIVNSIILHYTAADFNGTMNFFKKNSKIDKELAHYVIDLDGSIYRTADENKIARHAGVSYWNGFENINQHSIGIEIINFGHSKNNLKDGIQICKNDNCDGFWYPFPNEQIASLVEFLNIKIDELNIKPYNIIGHSDIAIPSGRKQDPGLMFPWEQLAKNGIGLWYNTNIQCKINSNDIAYSDLTTDQQKNILIDKLVEFGYPDPKSVADPNNKPYGIKITENISTIEKNRDNLILIYNLHYRQDKGYSNAFDEKDFEIVDSLICMKNITQNNDLSKSELIDLYNTVDHNYLLSKNYVFSL